MKKKIMIIGALPPPTGGMETVTEQMTVLKLKNYDIKIFNVAKNKIIRSNIVFNVISFVYRCIKLIIKILLEKPEIIHIHITAYKDFLQKSVMIKIAKLLNKKVIIHIHGGAFKEFYNNSNKKKKEKITKTLNSANSLIVLSEKWNDYFKMICPKQKIDVVPNCVDIDTISKYISKYPKKNKRFNILFVGRIEKPKGIYELLQAFSKIKKQNSYLYIMGPFVNNEKEIRQLTNKLGISDRTIFLGMIKGNERFKYFANSDLFILPSYWEGMPVTILEAMASGLPIVSTKVGAIPEVIKEDNGILVDPKNIQQLKNAILKIKKDKQKIKIYAINNIRKIIKDYNTSDFGRRLSKIYEETK